MLWLLIPVVLALSYYALLRPQLYWKRRNVKQGFPVPVLGDNFRLFFKLESMVEMVQNIYNKFKGERYCGMYQTTLPTLMIRDPDLIKQITIKDFDHFVDHRSFVSENADSIWTKGLFSLTGSAWKEMRATLSPTFTSSKMRAMFKLMESSAEQFVGYYMKKEDAKFDIELKDAYSRYANDVIANCAFGVQVDSLKDPSNIFYMKGKEITDFSGFFRLIKFFMIMIAPKVTKLLGLTMFSQSTADFFKDLVKDSVKLREEQNIVRPDVINLLMEARKGRLKYDEAIEEEDDTGFATVQESNVGKGSKKAELTDIDMAAQLMLFFFAGFDIVSTMMSFACYELAVNPEIQERLRDEVDETYEKCNGKLTYDALNKMKYMDMVISENLRKNAGGAVDRICTKPYTIEPVKPGEEPLEIKPGDVLWIPIAGIHHDEEFFPNPKKFDPERFSDENRDSIKQCSYIPFGSGPRNCIASRFALMEIKTLIYHIIHKFELVVIDKTVIPMKLDPKQFNPIIKGGFWVGFKKREHVVSYN